MSLLFKLRSAAWSLLGLLFTTMLSLSILGQPAAAQTPSRMEAGQLNVFLNDGRGQVHLLHRESGRTIFAFPAENSGVGLWFEGKMSCRADSLKSEPDDYGQTATCEFEVAEPVLIKTILLDNIRVLRGQTHGEPIARQAEAARARLAEKEHFNPAWAHPQTRFTPGKLEVERFQPSYGLYRLVLENPGMTQSAEGMQLAVGPLKVTVRCPFPPLERMTLKDLLRPEYFARVGSLSKRELSSLQALEFLATREKLMAGSWRFLTYFGRDTLISLSMLEPIISDQALEDGVRSVLRRLSPQGAVAHEEDIGSWAEWRHLDDPHPRLSLEPVYDYKMIDDDLLLPILLIKLQQQGRGAVVQRLLSDPQARKAIALNCDYNLARLARRQPLLLNPGQKVGDWRDSEEGLAGGVDPYSVNGALTVAALTSMQKLYASLGEPAKATRAADLVPIHQSMADRFWKTRSKDQLQKGLENFAATLGAGERQFLQKRWQAIQAKLPASVSLPVLSFNADGSANLVAHTDVCFNLFYGELSQERLERILSFLELPFPVGVITRAGPIVANPAFSSNPAHYRTLGPGQYHGMVVWSWQSAMLQLGLARQQGLHPRYAGRIQKLLAQLAEGEKTAGDLGTSELWGIQFAGQSVEPRPYGEGPDQTESNVLQLWSTVYPAVTYVLGIKSESGRQRKP